MCSPKRIFSKIHRIGNGGVWILRLGRKTCFEKNPTGMDEFLNRRNVLWETLPTIVHVLERREQACGCRNHFIDIEVVTCQGRLEDGRKGNSP
jgi:hypothetical protein